MAFLEKKTYNNKGIIVQLLNYVHYDSYDR